jgi:hypothetical protein
MANRIIQTLIFILCVAVLFLSGCRQDPGPLPVLAAEQIPTEFEKAFKLASAETRDLAAKVSSGVQAKDYPAAYDAVQALTSVPGTTQEQRALAARASLTIYGLLQAAQAQGDDKAAAALRYHQMSK